MTLQRCIAGLTFIIAVFAMAAVAGAAPTQSPGHVKVTGSTTMFPLLQQVAEIYMKRYPAMLVTVAGRGSTNGVRSLLAGLANAAGISRPLTLREQALARNQGIKLKATPAALGAAAVVVHPHNPVDNIQLDQLSKIYTGQISNWSQLGGEDRPITVLSRESNSGTFKFMQAKVMQGAKVRPDALILASNGLIVQEVMRNPRALGYVGMGYLNDKLKVLRVNRVSISLANVQTGKYPLTRKLFLLTRDPAPRAVSVYLELLLSRLGQEAVVQNGLAPVP